MQNRKIALDTETTGLNPKEGHKIVEIGCVELDHNIPTGKEWHAYINPKRNIPDAAVDVHGLEEKFLLDKPVFEEIADSFIEFIKKDILVIHNAKFDIGFLNSELISIGLPLLDLENAIDTVQLARQISPGAPASLDALCKRFDIDITNRKKHGALLDAQLLAEVYLELTGGRQGNLLLNKEKSLNSEESFKKEQKPDTRKIINMDLSDEEIDKHREYINKITNPIWEGE